MEPNNYPPPEPNSQPVSLGAPPVRPRRPGRTAAIVVASVVGLALVAGLAVTGVLAVVHDRNTGAEEGRQFTSSDGTFTMTLPAGWGDETEAYRADFVETQGSESTIEGFATADGLPYALSDNFVSMSGHPRLDVESTAVTVGSLDLEDWRSSFDQATDLPIETFTTDAGDDVWMGGLRGTTDGDEWMILVAAVVGDDALARFDLELRPQYFGARDEFRSSLKSLVFASEVPPEEHADPFPPRFDGRTYSSEEGASLIIPGSWTHLPVDSDADAFKSNIDFDFLGFWQIADGSGLDASTVWLVVSERAEPELGVLDALLTQFGEVGEVSSDGSGATYTVRAYEPWTAPSGADAAWIELVVDYGGSDVAELTGIVRVQRCYALASESREMMACIDGNADAIAAAIDAVEPALLTVEFAP